MTDQKISVRLVVTAQVSRESWDELEFSSEFTRENVVGYFADHIGVDTRVGISDRIAVQDVTVKVGDVVTDPDGYDGRVTSITDGMAMLDYSEFPSDVPAEATDWEVEELERVDDDDTCSDCGDTFDEDENGARCPHGCDTV